MSGPEDLHIMHETPAQLASQTENRPMARSLREKVDFILGRTISITLALGIVWYALSTIPGPPEQVAIAKVLTLAWLGEAVVLAPFKLISSAIKHQP